MNTSKHHYFQISEATNNFNLRFTTNVCTRFPHWHSQCMWNKSNLVLLLKQTEWNLKKFMTAGPNCQIYSLTISFAKLGKFNHIWACMITPIDSRCRYPKTWLIANNTTIRKAFHAFPHVLKCINLSLETKPLN